MGKIGLVSTDFDGTLIVHRLGEKCVPELADSLLEARDAGAKWAINTGRSLEHSVEGITLFCGPYLPDFLLVNERHIFKRNGTRWEADEKWNSLCDLRHKKLFEDATVFMERLRRWARRETGVTLLPMGETPLGIVTTDEEVMARVADFLDEELAAHPEFSYQRNAIYLRFSHKDYSKGSALAHLAKTLGVERGQVFAIGDHFNDLPMLDPEVAGLLACPANSIEPVKRAVSGAGGYVARGDAGSGTAESIRFFLAR